MVEMELSDVLADGIVPLKARTMSDSESLRSESQATGGQHAAATSTNCKPVQFKRSWADDVDQALTKKANSLTNIPKFIVISSAENQLTKMSPFFIQKGLESIGGNPKTVKKLRSGDLLIETASPLQAKSFLTAKQIAHIPISVAPHRTLNTCRGVISEFDLLHVSESEITQELSSQGVTETKRITIKKGQEIINTKHLILTFNMPSLPKELTAGYIRCSVRPYIPNPLRCFNCQRFGHSKNSCRGQVTCSRCAAVGHSFAECQLEPKCVNCHGPHTSNTRSCPRWLQEKEIQTIKCTQNISYPEARRQLVSSQPQLNKSYASVVKPKLVSTAVQTVISIPSTKHINLKGLYVKLPDAPTNSRSTSTNATSTNKPPKTTVANAPPKSKTLTHPSKNTVSNNKSNVKSLKNINKKGKKYSKETFLKVSKESVPNESLGSDSSECGDMEVEPGMETPAHLLPSTTKFWKNTPPHT